MQICSGISDFKPPFTMATNDFESEPSKSGEPWIEPKGDDPRVALSDEVQTEDVGQLTFQEYTSGGLGRHLGIFSTTFLVYVAPSVNQRGRFLTDTGSDASSGRASSPLRRRLSLVWEVWVHR